MGLLSHSKDRWKHRFCERRNCLLRTCHQRSSAWSLFVETFQASWAKPNGSSVSLSLLVWFQFTAAQVSLTFSGNTMFPQDYVLVAPNRDLLSSHGKDTVCQCRAAVVLRSYFSIGIDRVFVKPDCFKNKNCCQAFCQDIAESCL